MTDRRPSPGNVWRADRPLRDLRVNVVAHARCAQGTLSGKSSSEGRPRRERQRVCLSRPCLRVRDARSGGGETETGVTRGPSGPLGTLESLEPSTRRNGERFWTVPSRPCHSVVGRRWFRTHGEGVPSQTHRASPGFGQVPGRCVQTRKALRSLASVGKTPGCSQRPVRTRFFGAAA